jgi:hypothetical protein
MLLARFLTGIIEGWQRDDHRRGCNIERKDANVYATETRASENRCIIVLDRQQHARKHLQLLRIPHQRKFNSHNARMASGLYLLSDVVQARRRRGRIQNR